MNQDKGRVVEDINGSKSTKTVIALGETVALQLVPDISNKQGHPYENRAELEPTSHREVAEFIPPEQHLDVNTNACGVSSKTHASNCRKGGKWLSSKQVSGKNCGSKSGANQVSADADSSKSIRRSERNAAMDKADSLPKAAGTQDSAYLTLAAILAFASVSAGMNESGRGKVVLQPMRQQRDKATTAMQKPPKVFKSPVVAPTKRRSGGKHARA